ncbi:MAG: peptidase M15 [Caldithrix sp.]|nr:peptidase M15 [Caldithrix sp.]
MKICFVTLFIIVGLIQAQTPSEKEVVNIKDLMPEVVIDIRYSTTNNFTGQKLYSTDECFASRAMIKDLKLIQDSLHNIRHFDGRNFPDGLGMKVFDAYRPHTVQYLMFEIVGSPWVADPSGGSNHNRAAAIDITIIDRATGEELDMGTDFDYFGEPAWHGYDGHSAEVKANRSLLLGMMTDFSNFSYYSKEWWHYTHIPSKDFPLFDFQMK